MRAALRSSRPRRRLRPAIRPLIFAPDLFAGRLALVTGAASGIGAATAAALAQLGAEVIAADLASPSATAERIHPHTLDVTDEPAIARLVDELPRLDIVVNAAGIIRRGDEHGLDTFAHVLDVNLAGTMRVCTHARARLAVHGGAIVNLASMLSFFGGGLVPAYSASKGAIAQLTKSLAIAYAPDRIRVNAVAPGWIATPLTQPLLDDKNRSASILARTPLARWGTPDDIARAIVFLCSPASDFMTGTVIPVDGGYLIA